MGLPAMINKRITVDENCGSEVILLIGDVAFVRLTGGHDVVHIAPRRG